MISTDGDHTLTVRSHVLALRSCTVRTPCHRVLPFPGFFFRCGFHRKRQASLRRMRRLLLVIAIQARDTGTWCKEDQRTFRLRIPKHPRTLHNFTVWKLHFWCVFCLEQAKVLTVAEDVESIAESTFTLRGLGGSCWLRFNSTPEVFVQFVTVSCHQICCRVVVWCMHALYQNMSIFCVWLLSKCLFAWGWNKHYRERAFVYCTSAWRWRMFRSLKVCYFLVPLTCFSPGCMVCPNRMWY